ncbi:hypothetical protein GQ43DRAFT_440494 [Delitschia confertaspora ATCC 74209]|uniref:Uncharacterized protein n=1 Tax=Delitschia confertaspora ATCC 74209 TaxID=1513339 RepID=A0A9P4JQS9_9PLEO|nr:hypothetical protein GQ43DRAFT_440494 [Delitschia confertaspora ATCC 74209]
MHPRPSKPRYRPDAVQDAQMRRVPTSSRVRAGGTLRCSIAETGNQGLSAAPKNSSARLSRKPIRVSPNSPAAFFELCSLQLRAITGGCPSALAQLQKISRTECGASLSLEAVATCGTVAVARIGIAGRCSKANIHTNVPLKATQRSGSHGKRRVKADDG